jgi:hypothetical protein
VIFPTQITNLPAIFLSFDINLRMCVAIINISLNGSRMFEIIAEVTDFSYKNLGVLNIIFILHRL